MAGAPACPSPADGRRQRTLAAGINARSGGEPLLASSASVSLSSPDAPAGDTMLLLLPSTACSSDCLRTRRAAAVGRPAAAVTVWHAGREWAKERERENKR